MSHFLHYRCDTPCGQQSRGDRQGQISLRSSTPEVAVVERRKDEDKDGDGDRDEERRSGKRQEARGKARQ